MLSWLTVLVLLAVATLALGAAYYLWRDRLIDDRLLLAAAVVELGLLGQAVVGVVRIGGLGSGAERATFLAYALSLPVIPPAVTLLAIKEKTRWSMGVIIAGAFAVAVMTGRLAQIWGAHA